MERTRETTEQKLIDAVGELIAQTGFEKVGVNAVAAHSGVSKMLIYRYFGSIEGLIAAYIRRHDFWINFPTEMPAGNDLTAYVKQMFRGQLEQLRTNPTLRRLYRWELSTDNELIASLREQRERAGVARIEQFCALTGYPAHQVAATTTVLTASMTYLAMLQEFCPTYNGIPLDQDAGWEQIGRGIDAVIDNFFAKQ